MENNILKLPGLFKTYHPLVDGSMNLTFQTQEVDNVAKNAIFELHRQFGWIVFKPNQIAVKDIPKIDAEVKFGESPSKKMRSTLYVLYSEMGKPYGVTGFEKFYEEWTERFRSQVLEEITKVKGGQDASFR